MTDLTYTTDKMFTSFIANTDDGIEAWKEMAFRMDGVAKVLNCHAQDTIRQLKEAGYTVSKAKKVTKKEMNDIFAEMEAMGF